MSTPIKLDWQKLDCSNVLTARTGRKFGHLKIREALENLNYNDIAVFNRFFIYGNGEYCPPFLNTPHTTNIDPERLFHTLSTDLLISKHASPPQFLFVIYHCFSLFLFVCHHFSPSYEMLRDFL